MTEGNVTLKSPKRRQMLSWQTRNDTNDGALVTGIVGEDEYDLRSLPDLHGTAIDIGAHIGAVAVTLAAEHPGLRVIAVEPVPDNVAILRRNAARYDIEVVEAAGGAPGVEMVSLRWGYKSARNADQGYVADSRYIANLFGQGGVLRRVKAVSLDTLMDGLDRLALLKIDCEGCEWGFLRSDRVADVDIIIGEFHNGGGLDGLRDLLMTHDVVQTGGGEDVGTFRAVRR